jgi:predicted DNA-binding transcriptional regulator
MTWIWSALAVLATTGTILIIAEPARELTNAAFWLKMSLLAVGVVLTILVQRGVGKREDYWESSVSKRHMARVVAVVSILLWISIVSAGRWIGYIQHD